MTDLLLLAGLVWWLAALALWRRMFEGCLVLAACLLLERFMCGPEPAPEPARLLVYQLTVKDTRWGRANYPATHPVYEWVVPT